MSVQKRRGYDRREEKAGEKSGYIKTHALNHHQGQRRIQEWKLTLYHNSSKRLSGNKTFTCSVVYQFFY